MSAPDPATEAAATAIYVNYSEVRSSWTDWTEITEEARDYFRQLATAALDAAQSHVLARLGKCQDELRERGYPELAEWIAHLLDGGGT